MLLALNSINYGARLGCYFCLYHRHAKCLPQSWFIISSVIKQHLESGLLSNVITSLQILPIGRLIRFFLIFRLASMQLVMSFEIPSNAFLVPELPFQLPLCRVLTEGFFQFQKCMNILLRFMIHDIPDGTVSKGIDNTAHILAYLFNSAPRWHGVVWTSHFPFLHNFRDTCTYWGFPL